ncbi:MAG: glycosyltransferase family 2 protein [Nitrospirae bacterium]|nr:glycosyltransferase family 2 protein [Nitrospirota bacterium]
MAQQLQIWFAAALPWVNLFILVYYVVVNGVYFALLFAAGVGAVRHRRGHGTDSFEDLSALPTAPPVTVIVPAFNEAANLVQGVSALLSLNYPSHEVIVVDDGSTDDSLARLIDAFALTEVDLIYRAHIPTEPVRRFFVNPQLPGLTVVTKANSGKADSLNVGINLSRCPYFCSVDADSILERDALLRLMGPIMADPDEVVATGGIVRIGNGSTVEDGRIADVRLPKDLLSRLQVVEYLRCFLFGRAGWSNFGSLLILSGAFSLFRKHPVLELGGYSTRTVAEDMELVVRLHHHMRRGGKRYRVTFIADPICWTEAPTTLAQLGRQRRRWHQGLGETLIRHAFLTLNPRHGAVGLFGMPFQWVELWGPLVELVGYGVVAACALMGILSVQFLVLYLVLSLLLGVLLSVGSVLLEEMSARSYNRWQDLAVLMAMAVLENFGYRQLNVIWRVRGLFQFLSARRQWDTVHKRGFDAPARTGEVS